MENIITVKIFHGYVYLPQYVEKLQTLGFVFFVGVGGHAICYY